jgi:hypothetical protein
MATTRLTCLSRILVHVLSYNMWVWSVWEADMPKKNYTAEQIINKLREVEVMTAKGESMDSAVRKIGVTRNTYYRWHKESRFLFRPPPMSTRVTRTRPECSGACSLTAGFL